MFGFYTRVSCGTSTVTSGASSGDGSALTFAAARASCLRPSHAPSVPMWHLRRCVMPGDRTCGIKSIKIKWTSYYINHYRSILKTSWNCWKTLQVCKGDVWHNNFGGQVALLRWCDRAQPRICCRSLLPCWVRTVPNTSSKSIESTGCYRINAPWRLLVTWSTESICQTLMHVILRQRKLSVAVAIQRSFICPRHCSCTLCEASDALPLRRQRTLVLLQLPPRKNIDEKHENTIERYRKSVQRFDAWKQARSVWSGHHQAAIAMIHMLALPPESGPGVFGAGEKRSMRWKICQLTLRGLVFVYKPIFHNTYTTWLMMI